MTDGYLINRTPNSVLKGLIPYEKLYGIAPMYVHLKVFGSLCYAYNKGHNGDDFLREVEYVCSSEILTGKKIGGFFIWSSMFFLSHEMYVSVQKPLHMIYYTIKKKIYGL